MSLNRTVVLQISYVITLSDATVFSEPNPLTAVIYIVVCTQDRIANHSASPLGLALFSVPNAETYSVICKEILNLN